MVKSPFVSRTTIKLMDYWCYAIINNRLGEVYFTRHNKKVAIEGHSYLGQNEKLTKAEAVAVQHDIELNRFSYYRHHYRHAI